MFYTQRHERGHRNQFQQSNGILETEILWESATLGLNQSAQVRREGKSFGEVVACVWQRAVSPSLCRHLCDCSKQNAMRNRSRGSTAHRDRDGKEDIMNAKL